MASLSRYPEGWHRPELERRTGKLKVGQTTAGQEHWHSQTVAPFGPDADASLEMLATLVSLLIKDPIP